MSMNENWTRHVILRSYASERMVSLQSNEETYMDLVIFFEVKKSTGYAAVDEMVTSETR